MTRLGLTTAGLITLTIAAAAPAQDRHGGRGDRGSVTVFADDDFRGRRMDIDGPIARLGPTGMEDKISSIVINGGAWMVCTDDDFRGRCEVLDHSVRRLNRMGLEDNISSIRPAPRRRWR